MYIAGLDEVGRGALAGPLIAVASMFRFWLDWAQHNELDMNKSPIEGVNDSKKLTPKKRREVFHRILRSGRLVDFGIGEVSVEEINAMGIDKANSLAFERAVKDLSHGPHLILIDGENPLYGWEMARQWRQPRADGIWWPVGAASILAKVIRDSYMTELGLDFPVYGWEKNSGYGTEEHRCSLIDFGPCHLHRTQFIRSIGRTS